MKTYFKIFVYAVITIILLCNELLAQSPFVAASVKATGPIELKEVGAKHKTEGPSLWKEAMIKLNSQQTIKARYLR